MSPHFKWFTIRNALWPLLSCMHFNLQNNSNRANLWSQPHTATSALFTLLLSADIAFVVLISNTGMIITKIYVCLFCFVFENWLVFVSPRISEYLCLLIKKLLHFWIVKATKTTWLAKHAKNTWLGFKKDLWVFCHFGLKYNLYPIIINLSFS